MKMIALFFSCLFAGIIFGQDTLDFNQVTKKTSLFWNAPKYFFEGQPYSGYFASYYPSGKPHIIYRTYEGFLSGEVKQYYVNGQLMSFTNYAKGRRNGPMRYWYKSGKKQSETYYENGFLVDTSFSWYENGQLKNWSLHDGKGERTLAYTHYYEDGQKSVEITETTQKRWHPNGVLSFEGKIVDHKSEGKLKYYNEDGDLTKVEIYKNGKLKKTKEKKTIQQN